MTILTLPFEERVIGAREQFLKGLDELPRPLNEVASRRYLNRLERGRPRPMLGEYAPWLLADLLGVDKDRAVQEFIQSWLSLYAYVILVDDTLDREMPDNEMATIGAGLILAKGLTRLAVLAKQQGVEQILQEVDGLLTRTAAAACRELEIRGQWSRPKIASEIDCLGEKIAVLGLCVSYLAAVGGRQRSELDRAFDDFCTAVQLLDDITDWEEDWRARNYTYPLALALQRVRKAGLHVEPETLGADALLAAMIVTGALEEAVAESTRRLRHVIDQVGGSGGAIGRAFLQQIVENNQTFIHVVQPARRFFSRSAQRVGYRAWFEILPTRPDWLCRVNRVRQAFPIVAQQS